MDWKKNRLAIAAGVFVLATAGAIFAARSRSADGVAERPADASLPSFDVEAVDELVIERPDDEDLHFRKTEDGWQMQAPVEATADESAVSQAIEKLAELEVRSVVSTNPALHERLEVVEGKAIHAQVKKGGEPLLDVWLGPRKDTGTMVRQEGQEAVLAVGGAIRYPFTKGVHMYRDRVITDLDAERVTALQMQHGEDSYSFVRELPDGEWRQAEGDKPIEGFDPGRLKSLASSLSRLRAAGFDAPDTTPTAAGLEPPQATVVVEVAAEQEGAEPTTVELQLGKLHEDDNEYSLRLAGSDVPYRVSKLAGERLIATPESFVEQEKPAPQAQMPQNPHPAPGQPQLPPEVMKQLQQQLQQQQR